MVHHCIGYFMLRAVDQHFRPFRPGQFFSTRAVVWMLLA
jgi:hypothetical protein